MVSRTAQVKRIAGCFGKQRFNTYTMAQRLARRQNRRKDEGFAPYACPHCGGFHVGTNQAGGPPNAKLRDIRKSYAVWASNGSAEELVGYSNHADGEDLVRHIGPGWKVTRICQKR